MIMVAVIYNSVLVKPIVCLEYLSMFSVEVVMNDHQIGQHLTTLAGTMNYRVIYIIIFTHYYESKLGGVTLGCEVISSQYLKVDESVLSIYREKLVIC